MSRQLLANLLAEYIAADLTLLTESEDVGSNSAGPLIPQDDQILADLTRERNNIETVLDPEPSSPGEQLPLDPTLDIPSSIASRMDDLEMLL